MVVESMNGEVFLRVARSAGLGPLYAHMVKAVPSSNLSNSGNVSYSCELLVDNENLKDGKIPQVLGLALGAWLVSKVFMLIPPCSWILRPGWWAQREGGSQGGRDVFPPVPLPHVPFAVHQSLALCAGMKLVDPLPVDLISEPTICSCHLRFDIYMCVKNSASQLCIVYVGSVRRRES